MSENTNKTKVLSVQAVDRDKVLLEVQVAVEKVNKAIDGAYRDVISKVNIPGFRRGKAPRKLVEAKFGREYFYHEAQNTLLTPAYIEALNETNIRPINSELKDVFIEEGKPMVFKIEVQKEPIFEIKDYTGIQLKGGPIEADDKEIDSKLDDLRQRNSKLEIVTGRPAANGDFAIIDYQGYIDGKAVNAINGSNAMFELGVKRTIDGFEDGICGMNVNEEKDLELKFPEDYKSQEFAGKAVRFHITLKELKTKVLPELNDDFAKLLGEFNTLSELREDIKKKILTSKEEHQRAHYKEDICHHLLDKNQQVEAPEAMIEKEIDRIIRNYEIEFMLRRMDFNHYLQSTGQSVDVFKARHREDAIKNVKISNILSSIGDHEKITASEDDVNARVQELSLSYGKTYDEMKSQILEEGNLVYMKEEIVHEKVHDFLISKANIAIDPNYKCPHDHSDEHEHGPECDHDHDHE